MDESGDMTLNCISGLQDSLNVRVLFNYTSSNGKNRKTLLCMDYPYLSDRWLIYRNTAPPYDCILKVLNFSAVDYGTYQCYGILSGNEYDVSNAQKVPMSPEHNSGLSPSVIQAAVLVPLGIITLIIVVLVTCCCIWKRRRRAHYKQFADRQG